MKIYLVEACHESRDACGDECPDFTEPLAVFASKEKAKEYGRRFVDRNEIDRLIVTEWDVSE